MANQTDPLVPPFTGTNDRLWWFRGAIFFLAGTKYGLYIWPHAVSADSGGRVRQPRLE
jgi:hypothetical protein